MFVDRQYAIGFRSTPLAPRYFMGHPDFCNFYPEIQEGFNRAAADWSSAQEDKRVTEDSLRVRVADVNSLTN